MKYEFDSTGYTFGYNITGIKEVTDIHIDIEPYDFDDDSEDVNCDECFYSNTSINNYPCRVCRHCYAEPNSYGSYYKDNIVIDS